MLIKLNDFARVKYLLEPSQVKKIYIFIFLFLIAAILEVLGIGLVIPILNVMTQENISFNNYPFLKKINLNDFSKNEILLISMMTLVFVYTVKIFFLAFLAYKESIFLADVKTKVSKKIFKNYLKKSYAFHLQTNSAELIRNIIDVRWFVIALRGIMLIFTESIVLLFIGILLVMYEPRGAIISCLFLGFFGFIFYKIIQKKAVLWGRTRHIRDGLTMKYMQEGFSTLKEIKVLGRELKFIDNFHEQNFQSALSEQKQTFVLALPRLWIEWLGVISIVLLTIILLNFNKDFSSLIATLGLFMVAAYRIMPSVARIMSYKQNIQFSIPVIKTLHNEMQNDQSPEHEIINKNKEVVVKNLIEIKKLSFKYPKSQKMLFSNLDFKIKCGTAIGFVGDSGVGKTTLINIILGLLKPESGYVLSDGKTIYENLRSWQNQLGYVPQNIYLIDDTLKNNIALGVPDEKINDQLISNALVSARLSKFVNSLENGVDTIVGEFGGRLSGGQRQRIGLARAIYNNPKILILDEATNSLDKETEKVILNEVNLLKGKKTIIMVSHNYETLSNCDAIFKLTNDGIEEIVKKNI